LAVLAAAGCFGQNAAFSNFAHSKSMVHTSKPVCLHFSHCPTYSTTEQFTDLGKLNFPMVFWF